MRRLEKNYVFLGVFLLAACGDDGGSGSAPYNLTFGGTQYSPHEGQTLRVAVIDLSATQVVMTDSQVISGGAFRFRFPDLLQPERAYRVDFYADVNANGECEPSDDHVWSVAINGASGDVTLDETHNTSFSPTACASFETKEAKRKLTFAGSGFDPHNGQTVHIAVVRRDQNKVIKQGQIVVSGGNFTFEWDSALEDGKQYDVDYYADVDGNGSCDASDHVWREPIQAVSGDVTRNVTHSLDFTSAACGSFSATN